MKKAIFAAKTKIGCVSELKINLFIFYFSQLALSLQNTKVGKKAQT